MSAVVVVEDARCYENSKIKLNRIFSMISAVKSILGPGRLQFVNEVKSMLTNKRRSTRLATAGSPLLTGQTGALQNQNR